MTKGAIVEMDSFRLTSYAVQVPCFVCGARNGSEVELCTQCSAPMALARQAGHQKTEPLVIAALGSSGAGKTVYLGMLLDMLSRQKEHLQVLARGAFSVSLQQNTAASMARCQFPRKTPSEPDRWNWVHCQVRGPRMGKGVDLIVPDLAGEALFTEIDHPHSYRAIEQLLGKCAGVIVLVNACRLQEGMLDQDYFSMKLLSYLSESSAAGREPWRRRPLALVFSKADQCEECFDNPTAFAQRHTPGVWKFCEQRFERFRFFASGVAGACAVRHVPGEGAVQVPLRTEPRGVVEPFEWLLSELRK